MRVYYNEFDPKAAAWLRALIKSGHLPSGDVDERSIVDVRAGDLAGYGQCHFFAGIGGWPYALMLAGWPVERQVWTGSCPCQPFSAAGLRKGAEDARHLWPAFYKLIDQCRPATVFGEQVAAKAGREWLAGVRADLEGLGYGVGAADLCAAGEGAPHIRQRLWWVADAIGRGRDGWPLVEGRQEVGRVASAGTGEGGGMDHALLSRRQQSKGEIQTRRSAPKRAGGMGDADHAGPQGRRHGPEQYARERAPWASSLDNWLPCGDGKARRIEPGLEPLAHGTAARVVRLRGYGNAIVPQVAATFVEAFMETTSDA